MLNYVFKRYAYLFFIIGLVFSLLINGQHVYASAETGSSSSEQSKRAFTVQGLSIGTPIQEVLKKLGQPGRIDQSEYGFEWYIYNQDYARYVQVGIEKGQVVAIYTNATEWSAASGVGFGSTKKEVEQVYGQALTSIKKGTTVFNYQDSGKEYAIYLLDGVYTTIFYDVHQKNTVTAIQLINEDTELAFKKFYGEPSKELRESFERQAFDLANAVRVRSGKKPFEWNEKLAQTARKHSSDMVARNFFEHKNPDGKSPFDRMKADGITYKLASENIAAGQTNAIFVHESWMNSTGHRQNILGDYNRLGVGISFGGAFNIYYTQNFYQPHL